MKEKKYIDRLYQEKFKDFEAAPNEAVWKAISAKLKEEEKKRKPIVAPLWYRIAGAAAVLVFLVLIGNWILPIQNDPGIVNEEIDKYLQDPLITDPETTETLASQKEDSNEPDEPQAIPLEKNKSQQEIYKPKTVALQGLTSTGISSESEIITSTSIKNLEKQEPEIDRRKSLFDVIKEKDEEVIAEEVRKEFEFSTHAAPVYYGNFGKGNFLDVRFNNNSSEGEITYSYGINLAYVISDKFKIRSGVSKVNMSYKTSGITFYAGVGKMPISGVDLQVVSQNPQSKELDPVAVQKPFPGTKRSPVGNLLPGSLNQEMGFIEIPLELEYNIIDSKFGLNLIGGASTLFLNKNEVSVYSGDATATGQANNLNQISFSTNIGLGLDYDVSENFKLNFEPILKYQLNTFSNRLQDSQPYYLGVYSGFSFKF